MLKTPQFLGGFACAQRHHLVRRRAGRTIKVLVAYAQVSPPLEVGEHGQTRAVHIDSSASAVAALIKCFLFFWRFVCREQTSISKCASATQRHQQPMPLTQTPINKEPADENKPVHNLSNGSRNQSSRQPRRRHRRADGKRPTAAVDG